MDLAAIAKETEAVLDGMEDRGPSAMGLALRLRAVVEYAQQLEAQHNALRAEVERLVLDAEERGYDSGREAGWRDGEEAGRVSYEEG